MRPIIRSEFRKLTTVRGPWLLLAAGPLLVVAGITGLVESGGNVHDPGTERAALAHAGLAAVFPLILGILAVAGEYRHSTITDTYLSSPRRDRVIAAKLTVYALAGAAAGVLSSGAALAATAAWWAERGGHLQLSAADIWLTLLGGVAANGAFAAIGVGLGALIRNPAAAIAAALAWFALIEGIPASCSARRWPAGCLSTPARPRPVEPLGHGPAAAAVGWRPDAARLRGGLRGRRRLHYTQARCHLGKPDVLRGGDGQNLREYLIATAARLIGERGTGALTVRDIAREAQVADGVLYNYFEDKEDLLANALLAHVAAVMGSAPPLLPEPGTGTVADNLRRFIDGGLEVLKRVTPAFAGLVTQPKVLARFHAMVGGDAAFGAAAPRTGHPEAPPARPESTTVAGCRTCSARYLRAEQRLGRIAAAADVDAVVILIVGAIHGQVLPRLIFSPPGASIASTPADVPGRLAETILAGIGVTGR